jgi:hypothetical protein
MVESIASRAAAERAQAGHHDLGWDRRRRFWGGLSLRSGNQDGGCSGNQDGRRRREQREKPASVHSDLISGCRDGSGMRSTGYRFRSGVNGNSTVVPERHQVGCRRDLELVRLHLPAEHPA